MQILVFTILCLIWGSSWAAIKISLNGIPPFLGAALRFLIAIGTLWWMARLRGVNVRIPRGLLGLLILTGVLNFTIDYGLIYWAEQYLSAGVTAVFFACFPIFTGILTNFVFRSEPPRTQIYVGLLVGFAGVTVVFYEELSRAEFDATAAWASSAVIAGAGLGALGLVLVKRYLYGMHPFSLSLHQMIWGTAGLLVLGLLRGETGGIQLSGVNLAAVLYLGVVASAAAFSLLYWLLARSSAITASLIVYITPVVALLIDWTLMNEAVPVRTVLGMVLIFGGVALTGRRASAAGE